MKDANGGWREGHEQSEAHCTQQHMHSEARANKSTCTHNHMQNLTRTHGCMHACTHSICKGACQVEAKVTGNNALPNST